MNTVFFQLVDLCTTGIVFTNTTCGAFDPLIRLVCQTVGLHFAWQTIAQLFVHRGTAKQCQSSRESTCIIIIRPGHIEGARWSRDCCLSACSRDHAREFFQPVYQGVHRAGHTHVPQHPRGAAFQKPRSQRQGLCACAYFCEAGSKADLPI